MVKKRIVALCVIITMLCSLVPVFAADDEYSKYGDNLTIGEYIEILPPVEGQSNVFKNGELEGTASLPEWTPYGGSWDNKVTVDREVYYSGKSSLKLSDTEGKKPWARQFVPVTGGAVYQLTFRVRNSGTGVPFVKFEGYSDAEISNEFATGSETVYPGANTEWKRVSYIYRPHQNTRYAAIYLRMNDEAGTVWYDDVSMQMVVGPSKYSMELNSLNYYVSETTGYATFTVNKDTYKDFADWNVDYSILRGEEVIYEDKGISLSMGSAEIAFDLTRCDDRDAIYTFESTLSEGDEVATETKSVNFKRRYERPTVIGEDGLYYDENGELFNPVTAYHLYAKDYGLIEDFGITVVQLGHGMVLTPDKALKTLDTLHEKGAKAMVCLYLKNNIASHPDNREHVVAYIEAIKHHPAVWAWAVQDEPMLKNEDEANLTAAYELVREHDDKHPVYTIDQREWAYPALVRNADVVGIDNYPYGARDAMEYIYSSTKTAVKLAEKSGKPVYPLLQLMDRGSGKFSQTELYFPTGNAMRNMIYQALMAGAKGYGFFAFDWKMQDGTLTYATPTGDAICDYSEKEKELMFEYFIEKKYPTFNQNYEDNPDYRYFSFVKDGSVYMVILNRHEFTETKAEIPLLSDNGLVQLGSFRAAPYAGTAEGVSGLKTLSVTLEPGAAAVYKITANNKIDEEKLQKKVSPFTDLENHAWAQEQIEALYKKDIVNMPEEGKFLPGVNITRGEFAGFLVRTLGLENEAGEQFADVPADHPYAKEIAVGRAAGILNGVGENSYAPEAAITRQDMMTLIARGLSLGGKSDLSAFSDSDKIADYAIDCVSAMIAAGLIQGNSDGTINPLGNTTRAEAAVIMQRILDKK